MDLAIDQQKLYCFGGVSLNNGSGNALKQSGLKACILEGDRLALDDDCDGEQLSTSSSLENPSEC